MKQGTIKKAKNSDVEYLVLKNFIAVIKRNGLYPIFRCSVGVGANDIMSEMYRKIPTFTDIIVRNMSRENIYKDASNIDMFVSMMKQSMDGGMTVGSRDEQGTQHHVANCVNMLLHTFIERNVRDISLLEKLGGEIFELTCREIYGDEFKDVLPPPPANAEKLRELNQKLIECGGIPDEATMQEIRRFMEEHQRYAPTNEDPGAHFAPPMVDNDDLDFLDEMLADGDIDYLDDDIEEEDIDYLDDDDDIDWEVD